MALRSKLILIFLSLSIVCCSPLSDMRKKEKFDEKFHAYEDAVRWSDFATAASFLNPKESEKAYAKLEDLQQFKVTSYTVQKYIFSEDHSQALLIVGIEYFRKDGLVVNKLLDRQLWKYDTTEKEWFLTSGLPDFK